MTIAIWKLCMQNVDGEWLPSLNHSNDFATRHAGERYMNRRREALEGYRLIKFTGASESSTIARIDAQLDALASWKFRFEQPEIEEIRRKLKAERESLI